MGSLPFITKTAKAQFVSLFFRKTPSVEQIGAMIGAAVEKAVEKAVGERHANSTEALARSVESLFVKQLESFGQNTAAMGTFLAGIADLSVKRAAVALGQRGGRARAANMEKRKEQARRGSSAFPDCEVCANPRSQNSAAIVRHVNEGHDARRRADADADYQARLKQEHEDYIRAQAGGKTLN